MKAPRFAVRPFLVVYLLLMMFDLVPQSRGHVAITVDFPSLVLCLRHMVHDVSLGGRQACFAGFGDDVSPSRFQPEFSRNVQVQCYRVVEARDVC
jgi:hypothetical protein